MKFLALIAAAAVACAPLTVTAQNSPAKPAPKAQAKPAAKSAKAAPKKTTTAKKKPARKQITRRAAKAVEEVTPVAAVAAAALSAADLAVAQNVHTGRIQCELGADVTVSTDDKNPGYFNVSTKGARYHMHPVESRTGAIRLEDAKAGAMWLQLGNKSMLMNQKQGVRLADECQAPAQVAFANEMKKNPPKSLLEQK